MKGAILQPTYLPWLGYFEMISAVDIFVIYDHVQFVKKSWHHRNRIKGPNGEIMLTLPVKKSPLNTPIADIELASTYEKVLSEHFVSISHSYKKAEYFGMYSKSLESLYLAKYTSLADLTVAFIRYFCSQLGIATLFLRSSSLELNSSPLDSTERVLELCRVAQITELYDANGAKYLLDASRFVRDDIDVVFQNYEPSSYTQLFSGFLPYMSVIDLLLNEGPNSLNIIKNGRQNPIKMA